MHFWTSLDERSSKQMLHFIKLFIFVLWWLMTNFGPKIPQNRELPPPHIPPTIMVGRALTDNAGRRFIKFVSSFRLIVSYLLSSSVQPWPLIWRCALDQTNRGGGCLDTLFNVNCRTLFLFQKTKKKSNPGRPVEIWWWRHFWIVPASP